MSINLQNKELYLIDLSRDEPPLNRGKEKLRQSLTEQGLKTKEAAHWLGLEDSVIIVIGRTEKQPVRRLLDHRGIEVEGSAEGIIFQQFEIEGNRLLLLGGTDRRGLNYALLEAAETVKHSGLSGLMSRDNEVSYPDLKVRGVDRFLMGPLDDDWFYSEKFWNYYLDRLARNRFNRLVLITGFDTGYMSPPYPFFVDVPGFDEVRVRDFDEERKQKNLAQLRGIGRLCKRYGLDFYFGTWQQKPWTEDQKNPLSGISGEDELAAYCARGLETLLTECPGIDGLQLRVNFEAGVGSQQTAEDFWLQLIEAAARSQKKRTEKLKLALRAKGLTDEMITSALNLGLELEVPTKYWCEHTGLPYHLTQMRKKELNNLENLNHSRRYSYADLLEEPFFYDMVYRLWNFGSTNFLLWGNPDFARRFMKSIPVGSGRGFEISAPLSLKGGQASLQEEDWSLLEGENNPGHRWEDERYWLWYLVFGYLGYSTDTDREVWAREFRKRYGEKLASLMEEAYRVSGEILPLITAFHMPRHPALIYGPELSTGGALFAEHNYNTDFGKTTYGNTEPSDPGLFYALDEFVADFLEDDLEGKYTPLQVRNWFKELSAELTELLSEINTKAEEIKSSDQKVHSSEILDFAILKNLAAYHAAKIKAALELELYRATDRPVHLEKAHQSGSKAREVWQELTDLTAGNYHDDLVFGTGVGPGRRGHWQDRLDELKKDVQKLAEMKAQQQKKQTSLPEERKTAQLNQHHKAFSRLNYDCSERQLSFKIEIPDRHPAEKPLSVRVTVGGSPDLKKATLHYRNMNQLEGPFRSLRLEKNGQKLEGTIAQDYLRAGLNLMIYFTIPGKQSSVVYPGLYHSEAPGPYFTVEII